MTGRTPLFPNRGIRHPERNGRSLLASRRGRRLRGAIFALALFPSAVLAQSKIKLGTLLPDGTSQVNSLKAMGQQWKEQSQNAISLTIYAGGSMGSEQDLISKMRIGQLQAATVSVGGLSAIDPYVGAIQKIPLLFHSLDEMEYVRTKLESDMNSRLEAKGFIVLFWSDAGWVHIMSTKPYLRPDDFKKGKIFVTSDDHNEIELVNRLGFTAVPLEWSSTLTSLQTGMIDTVPMTPFYAEASQLDTVAKHLLKINYVTLVGATVITKRAWDRLTPEQRDILKKTGAGTAKEIQARSRAEADEAITAMKKRSNLQVHEVSPALEDEWRRFCETVYPKIRGGMVPADVFDKAVALVAEYRSQSKPAPSSDPKKGRL
jgi:TRAP-type C4-dicarboxylate transport system substrate-binding protein